MVSLGPGVLAGASPGDASSGGGPLAAELTRRGTLAAVVGRVTGGPAGHIEVTP